MSADNYVVLPNIALRINALEEYHEGRSNNSAIQGKWIARKMVLLKPQVAFSNHKKMQHCSSLHTARA